MRKTLFSFVCIVVSTITVIFAQGGVNARRYQLNQKGTPITTAVPFLLIGPDSRMGGMGETGAAVLDDVNAQHWNPSKYLFAQKDFGLSLSYSPWLAGLGVHDIHMLYLSGFYKATDMDAISFSLRFFSMGSMDITDNIGNKVTDAKPHEFAIDAAYSRVLVDGLSMAVTGRFIYSHLSTMSPTTQDIKNGMSGAADVSLFYTKKFKPGKLHNHNFNLGLNISNIGAKVSYSNYEDRRSRDFLPANFRLGFAYDMWIDKHNKFTFAFDINKLLVTSPPIYEIDDNGTTVYDGDWPVVASGRDPYRTAAPVAVFTSWFDAPGRYDEKTGKFTGKFAEEMREFIFNFGLEYAYNNLLFIRAGYFNEAEAKGARKYLTFGVGIKYSVFAIDAAYIIPLSKQRISPLEHTLRFTLSFEFDKVKKS